MTNSVDPDQADENDKQCRPWQYCLERMANSVYPDQTTENGNSLDPDQTAEIGKQFCLFVCVEA